ncbi:MAG TPA: hypothetical protein VF490_07580, partial [Chryseosolibacter sp.]
MARAMGAQGNELILVANNSERVRAYATKAKTNVFKPAGDDAYALITLADGKSYKHEFYYGSAYLSQSTRAMAVPQHTVSIKVFDFRGKSRDVNPFISMTE